MPATMIKTLRMLTRPSRSGQSIIIIAFGFIALIAFVGIATDTAMLFVRYSTLRRAVDAAAIAAAGAIRSSNVASGNGFATVAASAEQYIKIHGLDPKSVRVDTCATEVYDYMTKNLLNYSDTTAQAAATQYLAAQPGEELCTPQPQKLVRVSAQVNSPTSFLSLIGYNTVTLSASSVSQTAVLDVALLLDASFSEGYDTSDKEVGLPSSTLDSFSDFVNLWPSASNVAFDPNNLTGAAGGSHPVGSIRSECRGWAGDTSANYAYGGCCDEPVSMKDVASGQSATTWYIALNGAINSSNVASGENPEFTTAAGVTPGKNYSALICKPFKYVRDSARQFLTNVNFAQGDRAFLVVFDSAVHQLTSGGEYNNPDDAATATLPVFTTSDSAIQALNKYAGLEINPAGRQAARAYTPCVANNAAPYYQNQRHLANLNQTFGPSVSLYETVAPCLDTNTGGAILAAQGVITNASWIRRTAVWVMVLLSDGYPNRTPGLTAVSGKGGSPAIGGTNTYGSFHQVGALPYNLNFAAYPSFFSGYPPATTGSTIPGMTNEKVSTLTQKALTDPGFCPWYTFCDPTAGNYKGWQTGNVDLNSSDNFLQTTTYTGGQSYMAKTAYPDGFIDQFLYDGSGNKVGIAPLRVSDPNTGAPVPKAMQYNSQYCQQTEIEQDPIWWQVDGKDQYAHYPVYWQSGSGARIGCTATDPDVRHFCQDQLSGAINPADPTKCSAHYDAKDYARDMVDYAALIDYTSTVKGNSIAMYSIFFPHTSSSNPDIGENILGVKFMRYVADAGSDGTIKNHVQAWYRQDWQKNHNPDPQAPDAAAQYPYNGADTTNYGTTTEDLCAKYDFRELKLGSFAVGMVGTVQQPDYPNGNGYEGIYKTSCGNYYFADSASAISRAFVDIAGKLFTRLSH